MVKSIICNSTRELSLVCLPLVRVTGSEWLIGTMKLWRDLCPHCSKDYLHQTIQGFTPSPLTYHSGMVRLVGSLRYCRGHFDYSRYRSTHILLSYWAHCITVRGLVHVWFGGVLLAA